MAITAVWICRKCKKRNIATLETDKQTWLKCAYCKAETRNKKTVRPSWLFG